MGIGDDVARDDGIGSSSNWWATNDRAATHGHIVASARKLFRERGVRKTTMENIAVEAGVERPALYRFFSGRSELIEAAIVQRVGELGVEAEATIREDSTLIEVIAEMSASIIPKGVSDDELHILFAGTDEPALQYITLNFNPAVDRSARDVWRPYFGRARGRGELRGDLTDEEILDWLRGVWSMLKLAEEITPESIREAIYRFVAPALAPEASTITGEMMARRDPAKV